MATYSLSSTDHFADYLAKLDRPSESSQVIRCYWCGNKKNNPYGMCEACHRFPPPDKV